MKERNCIIVEAFMHKEHIKIMYYKEYDMSLYIEQGS